MIDKLNTDSIAAVIGSITWKGPAMQLWAKLYLIAPDLSYISHESPSALLTFPLAYESIVIPTPGFTITAPPRPGAAVVTSPRADMIALIMIYDQPYAVGQYGPASGLDTIAQFGYPNVYRLIAVAAPAPPPQVAGMDVVWH